MKVVLDLLGFTSTGFHLIYAPNHEFPGSGYGWGYAGLRRGQRLEGGTSEWMIRSKVTGLLGAHSGIHSVRMVVC